MINKFLSKGKSFCYITFNIKIFCTSFCRRMGESRNIPDPEVEKQYIQNIKSYIPKLTSQLHKGQCGRVGIIGGSLEYTGAPYFAAISGLKLGADLVYVICCREAAPVIKSYSPELIVYPFLDDPNVLQKVSSCLVRLHSLVIGPGLGRDPGVFKNVEAIIKHCNEACASLPLVIDADGLFLITENIDLVKNYLGPVVLTPNAVEYSRLCKKLCLAEPDVAKVAKALNVVILKKGNIDIICNGFYQNVLKLSDDDITIKCLEPGSVRRCGGQGDILSGCSGVFIAWVFMSMSHKYANFSRNFNLLIDRPQLKDETVEERKNEYENRYLAFSLACYAACSVTRHCSHLAFGKHGRSMTASDMIPMINDSFVKFFGE